MLPKTISLAISLICFSIAGYSQTPADTLARRIAGRMKDTLQLTTQQENNIYAINMQLHVQKLSARQTYAGNVDSVRVNIQRVENTRDSLYRAVLQDTQYTQYIHRKRNLVNNN